MSIQATSSPLEYVCTAGNASSVTSVGICPAEIQNSSNSPGAIWVSPVADHVIVSTTSVIDPPSPSSGSSSVRVVVSMSQPGIGCTDT